jgi:hypothetical protein
MLGHAAEEVAAAYTRPGVLVAELLHKAAFSGGLAQPLLPEPSAVEAMTAAKVKEYVDAVFTPGNMVVTGAGVDLGMLEQVGLGGGRQEQTVGCWMLCAMWSVEYSCCAPSSPPRSACLCSAARKPSVHPSGMAAAFHIFPCCHSACGSYVSGPTTRVQHT